MEQEYNTLVVLREPYNGAWEIDPSTRYLIRRREGAVAVYTNLAHNKKLQEIYTNLGTRMWGSVGTDDLMEGLV